MTEPVDIGTAHPVTRDVSDLYAAAAEIAARINAENTTIPPTSEPEPPPEGQE